MVDTILDAVDTLPADNITVKVLTALDFITPGQWQNITDFDEMIQAVTGERDSRTVARIRDRAQDLFLDPQRPYQRVLTLYKTIDKADGALAAAALANKVGEKISFLGFLNNITPKPDTVQSIDLLLKVAIELIAYCQLNGLQPNPIQFAQSLGENYQDAALMRMKALVCIDALLPLGTEFLAKIHQVISGSDNSGITQSPVFMAVNQYLPGDNPQDKVGFLSQSFTAVEGWMSGFVAKTGITPDSIAKSLGNFIQMADGKLDVIAAILDQTTNYYEHTGIQTVAKAVILTAHEQIKAEPDAPPAAMKSNSGDSGDSASGYGTGQRVEVWDEDEEDWFEAKILDERLKKNVTQYKVHYVGYDEDEDEWVDEGDVRSPASGSVDDNGHAIGQTVKVWDDDEEEWYSAVIRKIEEDEYFVHYVGYGTSDDEWVNIDDIA